MKHFVVVSVNTMNSNPKGRFEEKVNNLLAEGYEFLGPPQSDDPLWVAFMLKEDDSA